MKGVDTNILVRFLTGDDEVQTKKVYKILKECEKNKKQLFVASVVMLELIWVLESIYNITREDIIDSVNDLTLAPILKFENLSVLQQFVRVAKNSTYDLSDLLIAHSANFQGCESILTFDRKASKFTLFELVK